MNRTIYKYPLNAFSETNMVKLPPNSEVLSVQDQNDNIVLYAMVDPEKINQPHEERKIKMYTTGQAFSISTPHRYIGTLLMNFGAHVVHAFEVI